MIHSLKWAAPGIVFGSFLFVPPALTQNLTPTFEKEGILGIQGGNLITLRGRENRSLQVHHGPFVILHYDLNLRLAMTDESLGGTVTMTALFTDPTDTLSLNSVALQLDSVIVDGQSVPVQANPSTESIILALGRVRSPGDTALVRIAYRRIPGATRPSTRSGYYYFSSAIGNPGNLGYTMSEPSDARFWLPCLDEPWAKATASIHATVPHGYVAASNGKLVDVRTNPDSTITWDWDETHHIAPYLLCITASTFNISSLPFIRSQDDTVPVQYFTWPIDTNTVRHFLPTVVQMIKALSSRYGPYPFEKYGMSSVVPFAYGGMEHQTITTLNEYLQADESVVVHELSHQWWGDLVTCGSWPDVWLNEGFASYSQALWAESKGGPEALRSYLLSNFLLFNMGSWQGAVYDPVAQGFNLFDAVVYSKAAWALHMLRGLVGDSTFFGILRSYRKQFAEESAVTAQFASVVDSVSGMSMSWFFDQWIYGPGWPRLVSNYTWSPGHLRLSIQQVQPPSWPVFRLPMIVRASIGNGSADFAIVDSLRSQAFDFPLLRDPLTVLVDPDNWVLKELSGNAGGDQSETSFRLLQCFPNPFNTTTEIRFALPVPAKVKLTVFDILGREVTVLLDEERLTGFYATPFDGSRFASGVYIYRLEADRDDGNGRTTLTQKMILLR